MSPSSRWPVQPRRRRQNQRRRGGPALKRLPTLFISAGFIFIHLFNLLIPERSPNLHSEKLPPLEHATETVQRLRIAVVTEGRKGVTSLAWGHIQITLARSQHIQTCQQSEAPLLSRSPRGRTHGGHGGHGGRGSFPEGRPAEATRSQREASPPSWSTSGFDSLFFYSRKSQRGPGLRRLPGRKEPPTPTPPPPPPAVSGVSRKGGGSSRGRVIKPSRHIHNTRLWSR